MKVDDAVYSIKLMVLPIHRFTNYLLNFKKPIILKGLPIDIINGL